MNATAYPALRLKPPPDENSLFWGIAASILIHVMVAYVYPYLQRHEDPMIKMAIDVQMNMRQLPATVQTPQPQAETEQEPVKPAESIQKTLPKPIKKPPVLATQSNETDSAYQVESRPQTKTIQPASENEVVDLTQQTIEQKSADSEVTQNDVSAQQAQQTKQQPTSEIISSEEVWDSYGNALHAMVNKMKQYPPIAIRRHLEGSVEVVARFKQGKLIGVELLQTSGHESLNDEALRSIKKAIQQVALNTHLEGKTFTVTIPVNFALE